VENQKPTFPGPNVFKPPMKSNPAGAPKFPPQNRYIGFNPPSQNTFVKDHSGPFQENSQIESQHETLLSNKTAPTISPAISIGKIEPNNNDSFESPIKDIKETTTSHDLIETKPCEEKVYNELEQKEEEPPLQFEKKEAEKEEIIEEKEQLVHNIEDRENIEKDEQPNLVTEIYQTQEHQSPINEESNQPGNRLEEKNKEVHTVEEEEEYIPLAPVEKGLDGHPLDKDLDDNPLDKGLEDKAVIQLKAKKMSKTISTIQMRLD
jgi:hypothetical protein